MTVPALQAARTGQNPEAAVVAPGASSAQKIAYRRRCLRIITRWWVPRCTEFYGEWHWSLFWRLSCKFRVYFINFIESLVLIWLDVHMPLPSSHFLLYVGLRWAASHTTLLAVYFCFVFLLGVKGLLSYVRMKHVIHHFLRKAVYFQINVTCNGQKWTCKELFRIV